LKAKLGKKKKDIPESDHTSGTYKRKSLQDVAKDDPDVKGGLPAEDDPHLEGLSRIAKKRRDARVLACETRETLVGRGSGKGAGVREERGGEGRQK
jgi:hypothetical protein